MGFFDYIVHALNFLAPALAMALLLPTAARLVMPQRGPVTRWWQQAALCALAGTAVLLGGLWTFGNDGKMLTYTALVGVAASVQWLAAGGWRR
jgi:hypothetical protein